MTARSSGVAPSSSSAPQAARAERRADRRSARALFSVPLFPSCPQGPGAPRLSPRRPHRPHLGGAPAPPAVLTHALRARRCHLNLMSTELSKNTDFGAGEFPPSLPTTPASRWAGWAGPRADSRALIGGIPDNAQCVGGRGWGGGGSARDAGVGPSESCSAGLEALGCLWKARCWACWAIWGMCWHCCFNPSSCPQAARSARSAPSA